MAKLQPIEERIIFEYIGSEKGVEEEYPVYRCANDGDFYFLVPCFGRYCFKELMLKHLYEKYKKAYQLKRQ